MDGSVCRLITGCQPGLDFLLVIDIIIEYFGNFHGVGLFADLSYKAGLI